MPEAPVKFITQDNEVFEMTRKAVRHSTVLNGLFNNLGDKNGNNEPIRVNKEVTSAALKKVVEWCEKHKDQHIFPTFHNWEKHVSPWNKEFMNINNVMKKDVLMAAHHLEIAPLLKLCYKTVARTISNQIQGRTPQEQCRILGKTRQELREMGDTVHRHREENWREYWDAD